MDFTQMYAEHYDMVKRVVYRFVKNEETAHDLTQDTFIRAYTRMDSFRGDSRLTTWLTRIAMNVAKSYLSEQQRRVSTLPFVVGEGGEELYPASYKDVAGPESLHEAADLEEQLNLCIESMPEQFRETFELRNKELLSYDAIADQLGIPVNTVKSRLHRANKCLPKDILCQL